MHIVIVQLVVKDGYQQSFVERVQRQAADTLANEPECHGFDVYQDVSNRRRVLLYEIYTDAGAFARHLETPYFVAFDAETKEWIDNKDVEQRQRQEV